MGSSLRMRDVMTTPADCVRLDDTVAHARLEMIRRRVTHVPVLDAEERLLGLLGVEDLLAAVPPRTLLQALPPGAATVGQAMRSGSAAVRLLGTTSLEAAALQLHEQHATCAPVMDGNRVVGVVSAVDLLNALGPRHAGLARVGDIARPKMPAIPRHASVGAILRAFENADARDAVVVEGQAVLEGRGPGRRRAGAPAGPDPADFGVVGVVSQRSVLASAWFEHALRGQPYGKRIREGRREEAGGPKKLRHVEKVSGTAEDLLDRDVRWLSPENDIAHAARAICELGATGLPVLGPALAAPALLDQRDLLGALVQRAVPAPR